MTLLVHRAGIGIDVRTRVPEHWMRFLIVVERGYVYRSAVTLLRDRINMDRIQFRMNPEEIR